MIDSNASPDLGKKIGIALRKIDKVLSFEAIKEDERRKWTVARSQKTQGCSSQGTCKAVSRKAMKDRGRLGKSKWTSKLASKKKRKSNVRPDKHRAIVLTAGCSRTEEDDSNEESF